MRTVAPDDELLAAELARLDGKLEAVDAGRRRLLDVYQASLVELPELQRRTTEVERRRHDLGHRRGALTTQRQELTRDNQLRRRVRDFATRVLAVIDTLDFDTRNTSTPKRALLRLVVEDVPVTGWHVHIRIRSPSTTSSPHQRTPTQIPISPTRCQLKTQGPPAATLEPLPPGGRDRDARRSLRRLRSRTGSR